MKFFRTNNGIYINPKLVTYFRVAKSENMWLLRFGLTGGDTLEILFNTKSIAEQEKEAFIEFCEEMGL